MLSFLAGILALLLAPGPTNTLLALSAASRNGARMAWSIAATLLGYLCVVIPLATLPGAFFASHPWMAAGLKAAAAAWVLILAIRLWFPKAATHPAKNATEETSSANIISPRAIFVTTLLNPKGLIIGLVLMPHGNLASMSGHLMAVAAMITLASAIWTAFGAIALGRAESITPKTLSRIGAIVLAGFSLILTGSLIG